MGRPKKYDDIEMEGLILIENLILGNSIRDISRKYNISRSTLSLYRRRVMEDYGMMIKLRDDISKGKKKREHNTFIGWKLEVLVYYMFKRYGRDLPIAVMWTGQEKGFGVDVVVVFEEIEKMLLIECKNWREETWAGMDPEKTEDLILSRFVDAEALYTVPDTIPGIPWRDYEKIWVLAAPNRIPHNVRRYLETLLPEDKKVYYWEISMDTNEIDKSWGYPEFKYSMGMSFWKLFTNIELKRKFRSKTLQIMTERARNEVLEIIKPAIIESSHKNKKRKGKSKRSKKRKH